MACECSENELKFDIEWIWIMVMEIFNFIQPTNKTHARTLVWISAIHIYTHIVVAVTSLHSKVCLQSSNHMRSQILITKYQNWEHRKLLATWLLADSNNFEFKWHKAKCVCVHVQQMHALKHMFASNLCCELSNHTRMHNVVFEGEWTQWILISGILPIWWKFHDWKSTTTNEHETPWQFSNSFFVCSYAYARMSIMSIEY